SATDRTTGPAGYRRNPCRISRSWGRHWLVVQALTSPLMREHSMSSDEKLVCPSYQCVDGAVLLGVVQADGTVAFLSEPPPVDQQFVQIARAGRAPEKRFRFAHACAKGLCENWAKTRCGLAETMASQAAPTNAPLPPCPIRSECRWFAEQGPLACSVCPEVVRGGEE